MPEDYGDILDRYSDIIYDKVDSGKISHKRADELVQKLVEWGRVYYGNEMEEI